MTPNLPFASIDLDGPGWHTPEGYPDSIRQLILVDTLDASAGRGVRMLLMRFDPGADTGSAITHNEAEDVFVFEGDLVVGGPNAETAVVFNAPAFACRPGGVPHGPFASQSGCLMYVRFSYETD